jgi:hypothetical protein
MAAISKMTASGRGFVTFNRDIIEISSQTASNVAY